MHSSKKAVTTASRSVTYSCSVNKNVSKKKATSTQTDKSMFPFEELFKSKPNSKEDFVFDEEIKHAYSLALTYINNVHTFMNKKLCENYGECGDTNLEANSMFKLPDIPNYATIFTMLLEKGKSLNKTLNSHPAKEDAIKCGFKPNISGIPVPNMHKFAEFKTLNESDGASVQEQVKKTNSKLQISNTVEENIILFNKPNDFHITHRDENISYVKQVEIYSHKNRIDEGGHVIDSKLESEQEANQGKPVPTTAEPAHCGAVKETLKEFEDDNKPPERPAEAPSFDQQSIADLIKKRVQEEFVTYLNKSNEKQARMISSNHHVVTIQPQLNLLEYAQRKLERQMESNRNCEDQPRPHFDVVNIRPSTPQKVTNMFQRISQERLQNVAEIEDRRFAYQNDNLSDSDSVILDDEEFERMNGIYQREETSEQGREKDQISHPLKLTGKDMPKLNEKMLHTIGLFTERGDIRPGILDIMEKEKQAKAADSRNKQFRVKRQWDVQIQMNPKNHINTSLTSVSTEKSYITMSSDIKCDAENTKNA